MQECATARRQIMELTNDLERSRAEATSNARLVYELEADVERLRKDHAQVLATAQEERALSWELTQALQQKTNELRAAIHQTRSKEVELSELNGRWDGQVLELLRLRRENSELRELLSVQSAGPRPYERGWGRSDRPSPATLPYQR